MTRLIDLINPPSYGSNEQDKFKLETSNFDMFRLLTFISNASQVTNADFSTLSGQGTTPTTQANGDNFEFIDNWFIVGSTQATYSMTATGYAEDSQIQSNSDYFMDCQVFTYSGSGLYFYQRYPNKVRYFQNTFMTFTVHAFNNNSDPVKLRSVCNYNYGPSSELIESRPMYLNQGYNDLNVTIQTPSLDGKTVDNTNYVEFRLDFAQLEDGMADFELYQFKVEFGEMSTNLY